MNAENGSITTLATSVVKAREIASLASPPEEPSQNNKLAKKSGHGSIEELVRKRLGRLAKTNPRAKKLLAKLELDPDTTTLADVLVDTMIDAAVAGDVRMVSELLNRGYGKAADRPTGQGGGTIKIHLEVAKIERMLGLEIVVDANQAV